MKANANLIGNFMPRREQLVHLRGPKTVRSSLTVNRGRRQLITGLTFTFTLYRKPCQYIHGSSRVNSGAFVTGASDDSVRSIVIALAKDGHRLMGTHRLDSSCIRLMSLARPASARTPSTYSSSLVAASTLESASGVGGQIGAHRLRLDAAIRGWRILGELSAVYRPRPDTP